MITFFFICFFCSVLSLQVTTTGDFYVDDNVTVRINDCTVSIRWLIVPTALMKGPTENYTLYVSG